MKSIQAVIAAFGLIAATASHAIEAQPFQVPAMSTLSRAEVQAEAHRASNAGELRDGEFGYRFSEATVSQTSRAMVRAEAFRSSAKQASSERTMAGSLAIGGM